MVCFYFSRPVLVYAAFGEVVCAASRDDEVAPAVASYVSSFSSRSVMYGLLSEAEGSRGFRKADWMVKDVLYTDWICDGLTIAFLNISLRLEPTVFMMHSRRHSVESQLGVVSGFVGANVFEC